jgi:hypothetical protein
LRAKGNHDAVKTGDDVAHQSRSWIKRRDAAGNGGSKLCVEWKRGTIALDKIMGE